MFDRIASPRWGPEAWLVTFTTVAYAALCLDLFAWCHRVEKVDGPRPRRGM